MKFWLVLVLVFVAAGGLILTFVPAGSLSLAGRATYNSGDALLVRAPDGRCWRAATSRVEPGGNALSWRTDGSGLRVRVAGADWIEVARGDGTNAGLDWRLAAAVLGVDLGACLPVAEGAP